MKPNEANMVLIQAEEAVRSQQIEITTLQQVIHAKDRTIRILVKTLEDAMNKLGMDEEQQAKLDVYINEILSTVQEEGPAKDAPEIKVTVQ